MKLLPDPQRLISQARPSQREFLTRAIEASVERLLNPALGEHLGRVEAFHEGVQPWTLSEEEGRVVIDGPLHLEPKEVQELLQSLNPWRKGPFRFLGHDLEAEWDSSLKWSRLEEHLGGLWGKRILDVGCNNGYYLLRALVQDPAWAVGIDPTGRFFLQWKALTAGLELPRAEFHLLGMEHLEAFPPTFDVVLSMGILYHHPDPIGQLKDLKGVLKPGGWLVMESMGIPGSEALCLFPPDRYAKAPGVWFLPTASCLQNWMARAGFRDIRLLHSGPTTTEEQRNSPFCPRPFETLEDFLDPEDPSRTIEGHPAPWRHMILAR